MSKRPGRSITITNTVAPGQPTPLAACQQRRSCRSMQMVAVGGSGRAGSTGTGRAPGVVDGAGGGGVGVTGSSGSFIGTGADGSAVVGRAGDGADLGGIGGAGISSTRGSVLVEVLVVDVLVEV